MVRMMPWLILARGGTFLIQNTYRGLWRYTSIWDLWKIVFGTFLSSLVFFLFVRFGEGLKEYPRSIFVIDLVFLIFLMGGIRLPWRIYREFSRRSKGKRVLIYGAGDAGEMIVRDMKQHPEYKYNPIGFIDDNPSKVGHSIHGVPVLGTRKSLSKMIPLQKIEEVIFAVPSADPALKREMLTHLESFNIPIKTTPNLIDILDEKVTVDQIRNLSIEDLLTRMPVDLDLTSVRRMLEGKRVMVTGAGGSIGSELCRQIVDLNPDSVILFERYENGLYEILNELMRNGLKDRIHGIIGDITNADQVEMIFNKYKPEVIFHAAAHKHVPLMEDNPCEAIRNNVIGTRILAKAAIRHGTEKFVLVSTDKAVNPTSVMGATKRVAEMIIHAMADSSMTSFVAVRFGNVLASHGSVVPLFISQIKRGGPVTITDPEMRRYFMLIPEAVKLVLLAASLGGDAETYVLEMGEQIKVAEMARNLIRLSGMIPDVDIPIIFTGLRPGEKLFEELVGDDEKAEPSPIREILKIRQMRHIDPMTLRRKVHQLAKASLKNEERVVFGYLKELIPGFQSGKLEVSVSDRETLDNKKVIGLDHKTA
jgi:FlaA1/EpsC-like NDP-sugar epimerase